MERIALPTLMLLMLLSASPAVTQAVSNGQIEDSAQRFVVEGVEGPRTFRIIRAWEAVEGYLTDIENVGPGNRESLFRSRVVAPFESVCRPSAAGFQLPPAATPARELRHWLDQLKSDDVTAIVTEALRNAGRHLAAPETTVCIYMADPESPVQFMQGVGGVALGGADTIVLWTHPRDGWVERLPYVVAHEYHHVAAQALYRGRFARTPLYVLTLGGPRRYFRVASLPRQHGTVDPRRHARTGGAGLEGNQTAPGELLPGIWAALHDRQRK